ncbi:HEAT repeat domain-containing protein [Natrialbaceae archaeon A-arb3/5]
MSTDDVTFLYELARDADELKLLQYLTQSENPVIRKRTAEILGGLATGVSDDAQERIIRALVRTAKHDESDAVRAAAIDAIYLRDEDSLDRLTDELAASGVDETPDWMGAERVTDWLDAEHSEFRLLAAVSLGRIGDRAATGDLVGVFTDGDVRVRVRSVSACGLIGDPRCVDALARRLEDRTEQVRRAAATALAQIGTKDALKALVPAARSKSESVRLIAIGELGRFGNRKPVPVLLDALDDRSEQVRRTATRSLLELVANAPSDRSHQFRNDLADDLLEADADEFTVQCLPILNGNPPKHIRRNAAWLLGRVVGTEHRDAVQDCLIRLLDGDELTAKFVMATLVELDDGSLQPKLRQTIRDESVSSTVTTRAEYVLEKITRRSSREAVASGVDFTYVTTPSDYTNKKRDEESTEGRDE